MRTHQPALYVHALVLLLLAGCVGTDYLNDPVMLQPARIEITPNTFALEVGKSTILQAAYYDSLGNNVPGITFNWSSSDPATVAISANGTATALKTGQARITAHARNVSSEAALLTVVADPDQVATVEVTPASAMLAVGSMLQLNAVARNLSGAALTGKSFAWRSSNAAVATVNGNGLVSALAAGEVSITAEVEGVRSADARLTVVSTSRSGAFMRNPNTSYNVSGTATLEQQPNGTLVLKFGGDFSTSNGPGLEVFLSPSNAVGASSVNLGRLQKTGGAQNYNVPGSVTLSSHDWVIIHCVPFNVTFGSAQLK